MTVEMKKYKLGDVLEEFHSGNNIKAADIKDVGEYPVFGANGLRGYTDRYNCDGDVAIIGRQGAYCGNVKFFSGKAYYTEHAVIAKPKKGFDAKYLACKLPFYQLEKYQGQSAQPGLSVGTLSLIEVELPSYENQKEVARVLSALDKRIENLRAQNRVLEQTAKTIYDYTFLQCAGHQTTYNKTLNRNIPAEWEVKRLGDLVSVSKESLNPQNYPEKQFKHFSIPSFDDNGSYSLEYGKDIFSNKFIVNDNHVLISKLNPWKNRAVWCDENDDAIGSTEFVTLLPHKLEDKAFVFSVVKSDSFIEYCSDAATGTSHSHRRVSPDIMMKFPIAYDEKTVIKFNAQVTPLFKKQLVNTKQIEALTTQRNTLLPLLMTGQIEV